MIVPLFNLLLINISKAVIKRANPTNIRGRVSIASPRKTPIKAAGIEAINMNRRCIGVELKDDLAEKVSEKFTPKQLVTDVNIICADSASELAKEKIKARLDIMGKKQAQLLMLHPPYDDIIKFSDKKEDLSNCATTEEFYDLFEKVAKNGYDMLEKGRFACLIIGDKYANSQHIPLGFECMARMNKVPCRRKTPQPCRLSAHLQSEQQSLPSERENDFQVPRKPPLFMQISTFFIV